MSNERAGAWLSRVEKGDGPIYLAILKALEAAMRCGELERGDRLPTQRTVATALGVDITTVTRAFNEATARGLIDGAVGRGTFVSARALEDDPGLIDLSMNLPPPPAGLSLGALLRETTNSILQRGDVGRLMSYHPGTGTIGQQTAGVAWLAPCLGAVAPDRVLMAPGAQTVLAALLDVLAPPGSRVVVEPLTYPGFKLLAERMGVELISCPVDHDGFVPRELDRICREAKPAAIYVVPTMQNPTATTMSADRRHAVASVATTHGLWIIEDDPYSRLVEQPLAAIATYAPTRSYYVATLSKCLSPGLRIAFLVCPEGASSARVARSLRAFALMPSPLMAAVVTSWIRDGAAERLLNAVRLEARARRALAREILPDATASAAESIHVWLPMPAMWNAEGLRSAAQMRGLSLVTAETFAVGQQFANGVRISLGGPETTALMGDALHAVAELIGQAPRTGATVV